MAVILSPRGNEASNMMKRFVRYEEAVQYFGLDETLIIAYAKAAGAVYQLSKIRLIKIEPLEDYMKHLTKVGRSSKIIQRKFVRVGEGTLIYNIGRNRFIEMARAAGAVYKVGDSKGSKVLIRIMRDCNDEILEKADKADCTLLPKFSCHTLRHTFATRLCESGVNMKVIQDVLGHADVGTTMNIYTGATNELKQKEITAFSEYLNKLEEDSNTPQKEGMIVDRIVRGRSRKNR